MPFHLQIQLFHTICINCYILSRAILVLELQAFYIIMNICIAERGKITGETEKKDFAVSRKGQTLVFEHVSGGKGDIDRYIYTLINRGVGVFFTQT